MDDTPINKIPQTWCFILRCQILELMLASMKEITTSFIPQQRLQLLRIDLNHLDITSGITSPSVTRYFMPRRNTPKIDKIRADPSWDWFLSQKGIYGKGTLSANYLLRRVFTDYQDWSIPEFCLHELDEAKSQEKENDENSIFQSAHLGNTKDDKISDGEDNPNNMEASLSEEIDSDNAKEGKIMDPQKHGESDEEDDKSEESIDESCERNDESNEKGEKNEMGIVNALDLDIRNYQTDDWKVYWYQRLYNIDLPDKKHGISIARSMELNNPLNCHAWALVDVTLCGRDRPSAAELIALVSWGLRGMFCQIESLTNGTQPEHLSEVFPTMIIVFDQQCCARVLYGYFDGRFQVQFTPVLNFKEFTEVRSSTLNGYMDQIDKKKYYDMMHSLLRWAWPLGHHLTTIARP